MLWRNVNWNESLKTAVTGQQLTYFGIYYRCLCCNTPEMSWKTRDFEETVCITVQRSQQTSRRSNAILSEFLDLLLRNLYSTRTVSERRQLKEKPHTPHAANAEIIATAIHKYTIVTQIQRRNRTRRASDKGSELLKSDDNSFLCVRWYLKFCANIQHLDAFPFLCKLLPSIRSH